MHKIVDTYEEKTYLYRIIYISSSGIGQMKFPNTRYKMCHHGELHSDGVNGCTVPLDPNVPLPE